MALLYVVWFVLVQPSIDTGIYWPDEYWAFLVGLVFITTPCAILISIFMGKWEISTEGKNSEYLKDAGKYIGILERLFVFLFVTIGQWSGVSFLLGAKSIFRFGDLTKAKDRKLTEYILIGTLLSFGLAILTALISKVPAS